MQEIIKTGYDGDRIATDYNQFMKVIQDLINEGYEICSHDYFAHGKGSIIVKPKTK